MPIFWQSVNNVAVQEKYTRLTLDEHRAHVLSHLQQNQLHAPLSKTTIKGLINHLSVSNIGIQYHLLAHNDSHSSNSSSKEKNKQLICRGAASLSPVPSRAHLARCLIPAATRQRCTSNEAMAQ